MGLWQEQWEARIDPERFRAHDQYLEQRPDFPYAALVADLKRRDKWRPELKEDCAFGCVTAVVDGVTVSRDLLDSMNEIAFLEECGLEMRYLRALDIGAGYGRFAHRLLTAYPDAEVMCTDEIMTSMEVCAKYLRHRGVRHVQVSDPIGVRYQYRPYDLAVNIHSWSECTRDEVRGWMRTIRMLDIPKLFVIPHDPGFSTYNGGGSFMLDIEAAGFKLAHHWDGPECNPKSYNLFVRA